MAKLTEGHDVAWASTASEVGDAGLQFAVSGGSTIYLDKATKDSLCTATKCDLLNAAKEVLTTASFSGDDVDFSYFSLSGSTTYYVNAHKDGGAYDRRRGPTNGVSFPKNRHNINITGGIGGGTTDDPNDVFNLDSITTDTTNTTNYTATPSALALTMTLKAPTLVVTDIETPSTLAMSASVQAPTISISATITPSAVAMTTTMPAVATRSFIPTRDTADGSGGVGTKWIKKNYYDAEDLIVRKPKIKYPN